MIHLWTATLLLVLPAMANPALSFGRLEHRPSHCRIVVDKRPLKCTGLQISANGSGGLRLRFSGDDDKTGGSYQLSFVSLDGEQRSPLRCERSTCHLDQRNWSAPLLSTAWLRFDARGLPTGLPEARTASGRCSIDAETISCESHPHNIPAMSAEAQL